MLSVSFNLGFFMSSIKFFSILFLFIVCFQTTSASWTRQESNTLAWLHDVYFLNEKTGWIAGSNGTLLTTFDAGKSWNKAKNFTQDTLRQVYFTDENNGWLLCERDLYNLGANAASYLLKTSNGGATWEKIEFTGGKGRERIVRIFFSKEKKGFAVGGSGAFFTEQEDGKTWKKTPLPVINAIFDGFFTDDSKAAIVGTGETILLTENGGATWSKANVNGNQKAKLNSIFFINRNNGWTVGTEGKIYHTFNGGRVWYEQNSTVVKDLTSVFFNNTAEGWAIGDEGTILRTTTGGNVWTKIDSSVKHKLEKMFFVGKRGFAVGFGGTILLYDESRAEKDNYADAPKLQKRN